MCIRDSIIAIVAVLGPGIGNMYLAMWLVGWTSYARLVRSAVMVEKNAEYVQAARTLGYSHLRILFRHILPNVISGAIVYAVSDILMCMLMGCLLYTSMCIRDRDNLRCSTPMWSRDASFPGPTASLHR